LPTRTEATVPLPVTENFSSEIFTGLFVDFKLNVATDASTVPVSAAAMYIGDVEDSE
jgi:hypothetical protein